VSRFKGASKLFNMFSGGSSSSKKAKAVSGTAEAGTEAVDDADLDADKYVTQFNVTDMTVSLMLLLLALVQLLPLLLSSSLLVSSLLW
jgi:hypothetical protein